MLARAAALAVIGSAALAWSVPANAQTRFERAVVDVWGQDPQPECERELRRVCGGNPAAACRAKNRKRFEAAQERGFRRIRRSL